MSSNDVYWDELGVAWRAINPEPSVIAPKLETRLRRQAAAVLAIMVVGVPLSIGGLVLGISTAWIGWSHGIWNFIARGVAIIAISSLLAIAAFSRRGSGRVDSSSLADMLDLGIVQAERFRRAVRAGCWACGVAAVLGLLGYGIRVHFYRPPAMSPIEPLVLLALLVIALYLFGRRNRDDLARLKYLRGVLMRPDG
ncbi:MAG TPA: hypothetical protein VJ738_21665 [Steroidobacteraceae bacterium]|nr:hypothetical protein [Steroidobacteraceae bacterium]